MTDHEEDGDIPGIYVMGALPGKNDRSILAFCYEFPHSVTEIATYLGVTPSTYFRKNTINRLVNDGYLLEKVSGRKREYQSSHKKVQMK